MGSYIRLFQQSAFIPQPTLTENKLPDQTGKVHIVTGGYNGIGLELVNILYSKNATVYIAGRSEKKGMDAIKTTKAAYPSSQGRLEFVFVDLSDLSTIKKSVGLFLEKEMRLDVLVNNAGLMYPPVGSKDAQGFELQMGTNCLGPFLFTQSLMPLLKKTAASSPTGSVRVIWASSSVIEVGPSGGIEFDKSGAPKVHGDTNKDYAQSKVGNIFLASEMARQYGGDNVIAVAFNPGNLQTDLQRHIGNVARRLANTVLHKPIYGAYTELYAGWSSDITKERNGSYIIPWGRIGVARADVAAGLKSKDEGGSGAASQFWTWCEKVTAAYS